MARLGTLYFLCGKMAAGKSTLAAELARRENALLLVQDELLETLFPGEIRDIPAFVDRSTRLQKALGPSLRALLEKGMNVVLDFPANTKNQRGWFKSLYAGTDIGHELHFLDLSDAQCKRQLARRSEGLPEGSPWTSEAEFDAVTKYFQPPEAEEDFNVVRHLRE